MFDIDVFVARCVRESDRLHSARGELIRYVRTKLENGDLDMEEFAKIVDEQVKNEGDFWLTLSGAGAIQSYRKGGEK